jgi:glycosyltransferase involved in cell wall biosynthesis
LLCNTLSELQQDEHVVVTLFRTSENIPLPANCRHINLGAANERELFTKGWQLARIIRTFQPHLVHSHLYFSTLLAKAFTPGSIPLVFTQHFEFSKNAAKWYYAFADRLVSKKRHHVVAVSNAVLQDYLKTTRFKGSTHVINNYTPQRYFDQQAGYDLPQGTPLKLVAVGNVKTIKNQQYILDAFEHMKDLPVCCDIWGNGPQLEEQKREAEEKGLPVFFRGFTPDASTVLPTYHLYIMPSLTEGFPLALFEAMACGLPVVVSDIPVFREVLEGNGNYVSLQDPAQLRAVAEKYIHNPSLLQEEGAEMKALAARKTSKEKYLHSIEALYQQLVTR